MSITLAVLLTSLAATAESPALITPPKEKFKIKLVIDNPQNSILTSDAITAPNPRTHAYLIPTSQNHLKSTLDRALIGAYRLHFSPPDSIDSVLLRENIKIDLTVNDESLNLAEWLLVPEVAQKPEANLLIANISPETLHGIDEYLYASEPNEFIVRLRYISKAIASLPKSIRESAGAELEGAAIQRILKEPAYQLNDSILNRIGAVDAKNELFEIIDILVRHTSTSRQKVWLPKLFSHFISFTGTKATRSANSVTQISLMLQKISKLLKPFIEADIILAKNIKNEIFGKYGVLTNHSLDSLDSLYKDFITHKLISSDEHAAVIRQYSSYVSSWAFSPYMAQNQGFEFRLRRYISTLPKKSRGETLIQLLSTTLRQHDFILIQNQDELKELAIPNYKLYRIILDEALNSSDTSEYDDLIIKASMAYFRGQDSDTMPNEDLENYLIELLNKHVADDSNQRLKLLEAFEVAVTAPPFGPVSFVAELRKIFKNEKELLARFDTRYVEVLRRKIKIWAMQGLLPSVRVRQGKSSLIILKDIMQPADYFDFTKHISSVVSTGGRSENKLLEEIKKQLSAYNDVRPRERKPYLKLIDCGVKLESRM